MGTVLGPSEGGAAKVLLGGGLVGLHGGLGDVGKELLGGKVEDLDTVLGTNDEPVESLGEEDAVNGGLAIVGGEPLALDEVPNHDGAVTGSGGEVGGTVDHVEGVDLGLVSSEGVHEGHVQVVPDLDGLIPGGGDADSGLGGVVELDAGNGISVLVLVDGVLALGSGVPDLNLLVEASSDDLSIVGGKGNGEDVLGVTDELVDGSAAGDVPESDGAVPGGGEGESGVTGEANLRDEMGVS